MKHLVFEVSVWLQGFSSWCQGGLGDLGAGSRVDQPLKMLES